MKPPYVLRLKYGRNVTSAICSSSYDRLILLEKPYKILNGELE
jgi:hypothetical protein